MFDRFRRKKEKEKTTDEWDSDENNISLHEEASEPLDVDSNYHSFSSTSSNRSTSTNTPYSSSFLSDIQASGTFIFNGMGDSSGYDRMGVGSVLSIDRQEINNFPYQIYVDANSNLAINTDSLEPVHIQFDREVYDVELLENSITIKKKEANEDIDTGTFTQPIENSIQFSENLLQHSYSQQDT